MVSFHLILLHILCVLFSNNIVCQDVIKFIIFFSSSYIMCGQIICVAAIPKLLFKNLQCVFNWILFNVICVSIFKKYCLSVTNTFFICLPLKQQTIHLVNWPSRANNKTLSDLSDLLLWIDYRFHTHLICWLFNVALMC